MTARRPLLTAIRSLIRHARPWISKLEPQEPGIGAVGIQFEYEWPDAAKSLSEEGKAPARQEPVQHQKKYETATPELPAQR